MRSNMKKTILFDLDSTLLQMNQDEFVKCYFKSVALKVKEFAYDSLEFMKHFSNAAYCIITNDGSKTNKEVFWECMRKYYSDIDSKIALFDKYYENEFNEIKQIVRNNSLSKDIVSTLKSKGYQLILATNPLFPKICTIQRIKWADLDPNDFIYISTYENSHYCKPNPKYYLEILNKLSLHEDDCIMVGNDVSDDFSNLPSGMSKILITDFLINKNNLPIDMPSYTLEEFLQYIKERF